MTRQRVRHVTYLWLVSLLLCFQSDVTTGLLEKRLVEQVTCTYQSKSLIFLRLQETMSNNIVWYNKLSNFCGQNFTFSDCSASSEYVSVKAVISDLKSHRGGSRVLTCEAKIRQGQEVKTINVGNITITGPDTTSTGTETTQTPSTQTLTAGTAAKAGDNHGNKNTSYTSGMSSSGYQGISDTSDTPGNPNGSQGQHDTRDTSPLTVWMLGGVSAGLVLLAGLAALLAFKLKREKRKSHSLMYRIPESLPLHNSCLPVNRNSYLPAVSVFSPFNACHTPSVPPISSRERHLPVRRRLSPADHNEVYLTPSIPNSCPLTSDHRLQLDNLYTERDSQEDRTGGAEVANRGDMPDDSSSGIDDRDLYNSVADFTEESGESVDSTST